MENRYSVQLIDTLREISVSLRGIEQSLDALVAANPDALAAAVRQGARRNAFEMDKSEAAEARRRERPDG